MKTADLIQDFSEDCKARKLSPVTVDRYQSYLRHLADEYPELPTTTAQIEAYLARRGETPGARGEVFARIQIFYAYLDRAGILSPTPVPRGKMGRPKIEKPPKRPRGRPRKNGVGELTGAEINMHKVVGGGNTLLRSQGRSQSTPARARYNPETDTLPDRTWDCASLFLAACNARGLSERTISGYRTQLLSFSERFPNLPYTLEEIQTFWADIPRQQDEWKYQLFGTIRTFYYWLADLKGYPTRLNFRFIAPKRRRKVRDNLSAGQVQQLLALDMSDRDRALIKLIMEAGPRGGEIIGIDHEHVHDDHITIRGKTGQRDIRVGLDLANTLRGLTDSGAIFITQYGKRIGRETIHEIVKGHLARIGVTTGRRGPHMLRHTFGRLYLEYGGDLESLRQQLGHTTLAMTQRYSELASPQVHKRAMAASPLQNIQRQMSFDEALGEDNGQA